MKKIINILRLLAFVFVLYLSFCCYLSTAQAQLPTEWYLAEGSTDGFSEWILIQNPSSLPAYCTITLMRNDGTTEESILTVPATGRSSFDVSSVIPNESVSAKVETTNSDGIIVERAMYWDGGGMSWVGGHCSIGQTTPSSTLYFAEGCTDNFDEWILIQNPGSDTASLGITFMKLDGMTITYYITVEPTSRYSVDVNDYIPNENVSVKITSYNGVEVLAERSMYWDKEWVPWAGGHCSPGISSPNTVWYFAEGSTSGFDEWILIQNPSTNTANIDITFMKSDGSTIIENVTLIGTSRMSVHVNDIVPSESVSAKVESTNGVKIIAERAMYWDIGGNAVSNSYIAFGDSITYGVGVSYGYPIRLETKLDSIIASTVYNEGNPGERSSSGRYRLNSILESYRPEYVLLMEGTNDINSYRTLDSVIDNLEEMVKWSKFFGVKPVLSNFMVPDPADQHNIIDDEDLLDDEDIEVEEDVVEEEIEIQALDATFDEASWAVQQLAQEQNIPFVDTCSSIRQNESLMLDSIHPNDTGYALMSQAWYSKLIELRNDGYSLTGHFAGHCSPGVNSTATSWYLAEGSTDGFSEWVLIQNPNESDAQVKVTFMLPDGSTEVENITVVATSRYTINVNNVISDNSVSVKVESINSVGIIVERAMYWDVDGMSWGGGHCSVGYGI